jgi:hypothetical protein
MRMKNQTPPSIYNRMDSTNTYCFFGLAFLF